MASRANVVHGYSPVGPRPRRNAWYRSDTDPVVIPMQRARGSAGLLLSALVASCLIGGAAYAAYFSSPASLNETPAAPLERGFEPDREVFRATNLGLLQGPALAVPSLDSGEADELQALAPMTSPAEVLTAPQPRNNRREAEPPLPAEPAEPAEGPPVYPNPVTTPPDGIGPNLDLDQPATGTDPENPY